MHLKYIISLCVIFQISEVKFGGTTVFPALGVGAKPIQGSAILWNNAYLNGTIDDRLRHGGCKIILTTENDVFAV